MEKYIYFYRSAARQHLPACCLLHRCALLWLLPYGKQHSYQGHFLVCLQCVHLSHLFAFACESSWLCANWLILFLMVRAAHAKLHPVCFAWGVRKKKWPLQLSYLSPVQKKMRAGLILFVIFFPVYPSSDYSSLFFAQTYIQLRQVRTEFSSKLELNPGNSGK